MRVTETRMLELSTRHTSRVREQLAESQQELASGIAVSRPSQDRGSWMQGKRAELNLIGTATRESVIQRTEERLVHVEDAYNGLGGLLDRARELATSAANDTFNGDDRALMALEIRSIHEEALRLVNIKGSDGEYLLAGAAGDSIAFDANGAYQGDANERDVEIANGLVQVMGTSGIPFTAASGGLDIFAALDTFATALEANNTGGINTAIGEMASAREQVAEGRAAIGTRLRALQRADEARQDLEVRLASTRSDAIDTDPIKAASEFGQHTSALEAARAVASRLVSLFRG